MGGYASWSFNSAKMRSASASVSFSGFLPPMPSNSKRNALAILWLRGGKSPEIVQRVKLPLIVIHFRRERFHCCLMLVFQVESWGVPVLRQSCRRTTPKHSG